MSEIGNDVEADDDYETVEYEHPTYGLIQFDVLKGTSDEDAIKELEGMDLKSMFGLPTDDKAEGSEVEQLKKFENATNVGLRDDKWYAHDSLEGGQEIAFGHKLTADEVRTGIIKIGDDAVKWANGISREAADRLLAIDVSWAKKAAIQSLRKVGLDTIGDKVQALTSLIYNVGSGAWEKSKAKRYLETGHLEDFMHEAFSEKAGFVKIQGEVSRGLVSRRAAEARRFQSDNVVQSALEGGEEPQRATKVQVIPSAVSSFAESLARGVTYRMTGKDPGNVVNDLSTISEGSLAALNQMYKKVGLNSFSGEKDWKDIVGRDLSSTKGEGGGLVDKLIEISKNPSADMALTIGGGAFKKDKEGRVYLTDIYDFNPGDLGKKYKAIEKSLPGPFGPLAAISALSADKTIDGYTKLRILGFLYQTPGQRPTKIYLDGKPDKGVE